MTDGPNIDLPTHADEFLGADRLHADAAYAGARQWLVTTQIGERIGQDVAALFAANPPAGRTWVYGTGTLSQELARLCVSKPDVVLSGFLDRNADAIGSWDGLPVITPDFLRSGDVDTVMVGHATDEPKMIAKLREGGIPERSIWRSLTHPDLLRSQADRILADASVRWPQGVDACVISTLGRPWSVVPTAALGRLFTGRQAVHLTMGSDVYGASHRQDTMPTIHCGRSALLLGSMLEKLKPRRVYLRCSPHGYSEPYFSLVRQALPNATLVVELNDWTPLFGWDFLSGSLGLDEVAHRAALAGVHQACRDADLILCKNGGSKWERLATTFAAPCHLYYPSLDPFDVDAARPEAIAWGPSADMKRLLFAGSIDPRELERSPHVQGCQFLWAFGALATMPEVQMEIFNSGHPVGSASLPLHRLEAAIAALGQDGSRIVYHQMTDWGDIAKKFGRFDLALACSHGAGDRVEAVTTVGIGNKFAGYVDAGIPLITDENYAFAASLIRHFRAGVVIPPGDTDALMAAVDGADTAAMRIGMEQLRAHMMAHNADMLARLAEVLQ